MTVSLLQNQFLCSFHENCNISDKLAILSPNNTRNRQMKNPFCVHPILLSVVWMQIEWASTKFQFHCNWFRTFADAEFSIISLITELSAFLCCPPRYLHGIWKANPCAHENSCTQNHCKFRNLYPFLALAEESCEWPKWVFAISSHCAKDVFNKTLSKTVFKDCNQKEDSFPIWVGS